MANPCLLIRAIAREYSCSASAKAKYARRPGFDLHFLLRLNLYIKIE